MSSGEVVTGSDSNGDPPGRDTLKYRVGTYPVFLQRMLRQMQQPVLRLPDGTSPANALAALNPDDKEAFTPALFSAWAMVCDVLSFYQERIANEGYLGTAQESLSLRELARSIGYRPAPALSASTFLAFTMITADGAPAKLKLPTRTAVQSVPQQDETQVTFETIEEIEVRPEWNSFAALLRPVTVASQIVGGAKQLIVAGGVATVRPGMPVLLHGKPFLRRGKPTVASADVTQVRALTNVESNQRTTLLGWSQALEGASGELLMEAPEAVVFRQSARLFGATAPDWTRQPDTVKAQFTTRIGDISVASLLGKDWAPIGAGLPPGDVRARAVADDGSVVAVIGKRVVTHRPEGHWIGAADLPGRSEPTALGLGASGQIYVGTQRGELFSSTDRGATWFKLVSPTADGTKAAGLQGAPVQALFVAGGTGDTKLLAGTALGIWTGAPNGSDWTSWNAGLPGYDSKNGGATVSVNAFACDPARERWVVATDQGLFYAKKLGGYWYRAELQSEQASVALPLSQLRQWMHLPALPKPPAPAKPNPTSGAANAATRSEPAAAETPAVPSRPNGQSVLAGPTYALAMLTGDTRGVAIFAGTKQGVWCSSNGGRSWRPAATQPGGVTGAVKQMGAAQAGLLAGTDKGLFQSADAGSTWAAASGPFAGQPLAALAAAAGWQVAAAPFGGYPGSEWPKFGVAGRQLDLDRTYESVIPGSWIVVARPKPGASTQTDFAAARVVAASTAFRHDYLINDRVTRVVLDRDLPPLDPRTATVYLHSRALDAANPVRHHVEILGSGHAAPPPSNVSLAGPVRRLNGRLISISGRRAGARLNGSAGGVRRWNGSSWTKLGAFDNDSRALLIARDGTIFLGTRNGVQRFDGESWSPLGDLREEVNVLAEIDDGEWLAGTEGGLWRWKDKAWTLLGPARRCVLALLVEAGGAIIAGTSRGLDTSADGGRSWISAGGAVSRRAITALARSRSGLLIAGTHDGLFVATAEDWSHAAHVLRGQTVRGLALNSQGQICAATVNGVFWSDDGLAWPTSRPDRGQGDIRAVAFDPHNDDLYIAQRGVGVIAPEGILWAGVANDFRTLAFDRDGKLVAGSMSSTALLAADGTAAIEPKFVADVSGDDLVERLIAGPLSADLRHVFMKEEIALSEKAEVSILAKGLRWAISDGAAYYIIHASGSDGVKVFAEGEFEVLAWPKPVANRPDLELWRVRNKDDIVADLPAIRSRIEPTFAADVSGDGLLQYLTAGPVSGELHHVFTEKQIDLSEQAEVNVLTPGLKWRISDGTTHYTVDALGADSAKVFVEGDPSANAGEIVFIKAAATNEAVAEIHTVVDAAIAPDRSRTDLLLKEPLENVYDAATVSFNANVARASHGETPALYEVIGSGDSSVPNQTFTLQRKPISVRPTDSGAWNYEIVVRVRGSFQSEALTINEQLIPDGSEDKPINPDGSEERPIEWQRVETLTLSGPDDPHYELRENDDSSITLLFGDGKQGKRLPTGTENVIALYRTGSGPDGNVKPGRLTLLRRRPAGVQKVTNPTRACGGEIGEIDASVRLAAPIAVRTFGRIVSLRDYHDYVRAWPGIAKVAVRSLSLPGQPHPLVHVTIADINDATTLASDSQDQPANDYSDLRRAILGHRAVDCAIAIERYVPRWFRLEADIAADTNRDMAAVSAAVSSMLLDRYGFMRRHLGEQVTAADVTAAIQDVPGVRAVNLKSLQLVNGKSELLKIIPVREAYWDEAAQAVHPAELLLVGGGNHIVLGEIQS
jgi:hypothetical protein